MSDRDQPALGETIGTEFRGWSLAIGCGTAGQLMLDDVPPETVVFAGTIKRGGKWYAVAASPSFRNVEKWCFDTAYALELARLEAADE